MVLSVPGRILALGHATSTTRTRRRCACWSNAELEALIAQFEPVAPAPDHSGARDWSDLDQRMHYIVHLFRVFHAQARPVRRAVHARSRSSAFLRA